MTNSRGDIENKISEVSKFKDEDSFNLFVRKKAEKIVTTLYFVTDYLQDQEPLKWSLRSKCVNLIGNLLPDTKEGLSIRNKSLIKSRLTEIISLLKLASSARILSEMNSELLKDACLSLMNHINEIENKEQLSGSIFEVPLVSKESQSSSSETESTFYRTSNRLVNDMSDKDDFDSKIDLDSRITTENQGLSIAKRHDQIISVLKNRESVTIGDIRGEIEGVSDKTLQRDLSALVEKGTIERSGSRRWTSYTIV